VPDLAQTPEYIGGARVRNQNLGFFFLVRAVTVFSARVFPAGLYARNRAVPVPQTDPFAGCLASFWEGIFLALVLPRH